MGLYFRTSRSVGEPIVEESDDWNRDVVIVHFMDEAVVVNTVKGFV